MENDFPIFCAVSDLAWFRRPDRPGVAGASGIGGAVRRAPKRDQVSQRVMPSCPLQPIASSTWRAPRHQGLREPRARLTVDVDGSSGGGAACANLRCRRRVDVDGGARPKPRSRRRSSTRASPPAAPPTRSAATRSRDEQPEGELRGRRASSTRRSSRRSSSPSDAASRSAPAKLTPRPRRGDGGAPAPAAAEIAGAAPPATSGTVVRVPPRPPRARAAAGVFPRASCREA